jgi:hypothetical protein
LTFLFELVEVTLKANKGIIAKDWCFSLSTLDGTVVLKDSAVDNRLVSEVLASVGSPVVCISLVASIVLAYQTLHSLAPFCDHHR